MIVTPDIARALALDLMSQMPLEAMDLIVDAKGQRVTFNPEHPWGMTLRA
jgi:hypothetical protein